MTKFGINVLKFSKKSYSLFSGPEKLPLLDLTGQEANDLILNNLRMSKPLMVARFGATEMNSLANYISIRDHKNNYIRYIKGEVHHFWWDKNTIITMKEQSGFYPSNPRNLERFYELMYNDIKELDILGSWLNKEIIFKNELSHVKKVGLRDLEPYRHSNPWTSALENKYVLVIHPFEESIRIQYKKRKSLFKDPMILPAFNLKTIKAVQSIDDDNLQFGSWFEALDFMKDKISNTEFDIAIIGCGAYGFPLAAHVKRLGKKAVHLGGATQILFGIIGKRWEREKEYEFVVQMKNSSWVRPLDNETPLGAKKLENSCYW